ncbi:MAG: transglutaminase domain-containing protein [Lachnospiraceae bacterium]|nr:transglutaminase domain-containing protein [Lachnospiraceae bacterium]
MSGFIYELLYTLPLAVMIVTGFPEITGAAGPSEITGGAGLSISLYIAVILFSVLWVFLFNSDKKGKALVGGIAAAALTGLLLIRDAEERQALILEHAFLIRIFIICALSYALVRLLTRFKKALLISGLLLVAFLLSLMFSGARPEKMTVAASVLLLALILSEAIQAHWKKEGYTEARTHLIHAAPFILAALLSAFSFNLPDRPYDWKLFIDIAENIRRGCEDVLLAFLPPGGWDSDDAVIGFSERADLKGSIRNDTFMAIEIESDRATDERLYFAGKTFDSFNGKSWSKTDKDNAAYPVLDTIETMTAVVAYSPDRVYDLMRKARAFVTYEGLRTSCIFIPQKTFDITTERNAEYRGGDLAYKNRKDNGYSLSFYQVNQSNPVFRDLLSSGHKPDKALWEESARRIGLSAEGDFSYDKYLKYKEHIVNSYLQDPGLSEDMRRHMDTLIGDETDDLKKLELIESELNNMTYNNSPGAIPSDIDSGAEFLDYFVLGKKEGFCTHYATAFVLMARSIGIPARYVQGYSKTVKNVRSFPVMSDNAHAWGEAYIDGIGWIAFEPTPGYKHEAYWEIEGVTAEKKDPVVPPGSVDNGPVSESSAETEEEPSLSLTLTQIIIPLLIGLSFIGLTLLADSVYRKRRYSRLDSRDKLIHICRRGLKRIEGVCRKREPGETLSEFSADLGDEAPSELHDLIRLYENVSYDDKEISDGDIPPAEELLRSIERFALKKRLGSLRRRPKRK